MLCDLLSLLTLSDSGPCTVTQAPRGARPGWGLLQCIPTFHEGSGTRWVPVHAWVEPAQPKVPISVTSLSLPQPSAGRQSYRRPSSFLRRPHLSWGHACWGHVCLSCPPPSFCPHKQAFASGAFHPARPVTTAPTRMRGSAPGAVPVCGATLTARGEWVGAHASDRDYVRTTGDQNEIIWGSRAKPPDDLAHRGLQKGIPAPALTHSASPLCLPVLTPFPPTSSHFKSTYYMLGTVKKKFKNHFNNPKV